MIAAAAVTSSSTDYLPLIALVVGSLLTFIGGMVAEERRANREDRRTSAQSRADRAEATRTFQRETVMKLQDELGRMASAAAERANAKDDAADDTAWRDWRAAAASFEPLAARLDDERLRELAVETRKLHLAWMRADSKGAGTASVDAWQSYLDLQARAGEVLRALNSDDDK